MAVYGTMIITQQGLALYAKAQTGIQLNFTRMQIGSGRLADGQDPTKLTALITPISFFPINSITSKDNVAYVKGIFENKSISAPTYTCELGLFAQDPNAGEILFAYANAGGQGDTVPPITSGPLSKQYQINAAVGSASNVTAIIPADAYIPSTEKGAADGVAPLDRNKKVPLTHIPAISAESITLTSPNFASKNVKDGMDELSGRTKTADSTAQSAQQRANACLPKNGSEPMTGRLVVPAGPGGGVAFPDNPFGGSGDSASITLRQKSGEDMELTIEVQNDPTDTINFITPSGTGLKANGNTIWHAGNDGWGSGLDADVLRGMTPTDQAYGNSIVQRRADGGTDVATIYAANWLRSRGQTGWYSEDYGGGWYMTDTTWIRAYNGKSVHTSGHLSADGEIFLRGTALAATRLNNGVLEFWNGSWWQPVGGVKYVQRGEANVATESIVNVRIDPVNINKSFVNFPNTGGTTSSSYPNGYARLIDSTTLQIRAAMFGTYQYEIVEYY
ncbi:shufflon system plasmid conjugative transfer pilus tip adhesin PilV [Paenibacillus sp. A3]|uniref:shufflon system plasmid conjugative transfer pilus tip adhesin PilV n=1 Tax=Paenibacillus sp. A3 TaxID=1337054 RepID=UPI0006D53DFD|nr:shufflon system plasmid conjugative transfer pilus tip adhesin PilV [Paenibacillus sp. A3]